MSTKIIDCTCHNEYQDVNYGKGKRVANKCKPTGKVDTYRCSVCEVTKVVSNDSK